MCLICIHQQCVDKWQLITPRYVSTFQHEREKNAVWKDEKSFVCLLDIMIYIEVFFVHSLICLFSHVVSRETFQNVVNK